MGRYKFSCFVTMEGSADVLVDAESLEDAALELEKHGLNSAYVDLADFNDYANNATMEIEMVESDGEEVAHTGSEPPTQEGKSR